MTSPQRQIVTIGHQSGDSVGIQILGRPHADSTSFWDANWLTAQLRLSVGSFRADIKASLRAEELLKFGQELDAMCASLQKEASLKTMEEWLSIEFLDDGVNGFRISGRVADNPGSANVLSFKIHEVDKFDVMATANVLRKTCESYPIIGSVK